MFFLPQIRVWNRLSSSKWHSGYWQEKKDATARSDDETLSSVSSRWCHLYHLIRVLAVCHPRVQRTENLILIQSWRGRGPAALAQALSWIWRRGLLVAADDFLSVKQLWGSPRQISLWYWRAIKCEEGHLWAGNSQLYLLPCRSSWRAFPYKERRKGSGWGS